MNDRYGRFGTAIKIGKDEVITDFLGESCSLDADEKSIKENLRIVDNYCRLRLLDKFLDAYYEAYVASLYKDADSGKWIKKFIGQKMKSATF